jgi:Putative prokaryotic signal transducing protein
VNAEIRFAVAELHVSPWEAHVSRALLESEGIPAFVAEEHQVTANWSMSGVLGGVRLLVPVEHLDAARTTFAMRDRGDLEAALVEQYPPETFTCARCGSPNFAEKRQWLSIALAVILLITMRVIFPPSKLRECTTCRHSE